jgi:hypothetical protein
MRFRQILLALGVGGIEETSASFEARSAPRPYPTDDNNTPEIDVCNE